MADQVKELYKGEILFGNYTSGTQTLYTTDSTKTAVIKDVEIGSTGYTTAPTLQVSDFNVANLSSNATGSEIVGINSTVKIKNNQSTSGYRMMAVKYMLDAANTTQFFPATNPAGIFIPASPPVSATKGSVTTVAGGTLTGTTSIYWAYEINGFIYYFVWDGNSSSQFYYRNISTGANTTVNTNSYCPVTFDGVSKFYYMKSSSLYVFDTTTNMENTIASGIWPSGSTYPQIWCINNVVFYKNTYSAGTMYWYNTTTGVNSSFSAPSSWYSSDAFAAVGFYDSSTYTYTLAWSGAKANSSFLSLIHI